MFYLGPHYNTLDRFLDDFPSSVLKLEGLQDAEYMR